MNIDLYYNDAHCLERTLSDTDCSKNSITTEINDTTFKEVTYRNIVRICKCILYFSPNSSILMQLLSIFLPVIRK
jgi:hypothetical protein